MSAINDYNTEENKTTPPFFGLPKIYPYIKQYGKRTIILILFLLVTCVIDLIMPLFTKYAIDTYFKGGNITGVGLYALLYTAASVLQTAATVTWLRMSIESEVYCSRDLRRMGFNHLQTLSF